MGLKSGRARITLLSSAGDDPGGGFLYQRYYLTGLRRLAQVDLQFESALDGRLAAVHQMGLPGIDRLWRQVARWTPARRYVEATHVGRYLFEFPDAEPLRVAIDGHDMRYVRDPDALEWADVYYKVSRWPTIHYDPKVRPLICGNGALSEARVQRLLRMRNRRERDLDLVFIAKLWPGRVGEPTYWNPVEHGVRMFETLAKLPIRAHLRAIVPVLIDGAPFPTHYLRRLEDAGVPLIHKGDVSVRELWDTSSRAQLAFLRPGKHLCVSWRMIDYLAIGACTVCDRAAYPEWPVPLRSGKEFIAADCGVSPQHELPELADYARIADTVQSLLADPARMQETREHASRYFDKYVAHEALARDLLADAQARSAARSTPAIRQAPSPAKVARAMPAPAVTVSGAEREKPVPISSVSLVGGGIDPLQTSLLEFTHDAIIIWEMQGRGILFWNQAAESLYGFSRAEAQGRTTHELLQTHTQEGVAALESGLEKYGIWVGELRHTHKSGEHRFVEARLSVLAQTDGRWLVLEVNRDIGDRKAAADQRQLMREQLLTLQRGMRTNESD